MTRLTVKIVPARTVLVWTVPFPDTADGAVVLEAWQNLAANAPDELSCALAAQAGNGQVGAPVLFVAGEFRVEAGVTVEAATATLTDVLRTQWLDRLPPPLNLVPIDIKVMTTIDAATAVAELVPIPLWDQWKLNSRFTFRSLTAAQWQPVFDYIRTHVPADDPAKAVGSVNPWLMGGASNRIDPDSAAIPVREGAVTWLAFGALWNDPLVEDQALAWVEGLTQVIDQAVQSGTAFYGSPELELGSQLTSPPTLGYLDAYWKSPTHDFVPFLRGVKQKYDPTDVFKGPQTIPLSLTAAAPRSARGT
jgi:hypothetical protein